MKRNAKVLSTMCLGLMAATAAHAQQPGVRSPSGTGTTTAAEAAAKVATTGTPTSTAMVGAPPPAAPAAKAAVAGAGGSTTAAPVNPGKLIDGKVPPP
jgi:hypothetical protein